MAVWHSAPTTRALRRHVWQGDEHEWDDDAPDCGDDPFANDEVFARWQDHHDMADPDEVARVEQLLDNSSLSSSIASWL